MTDSSIPESAPCPSKTGRATIKIETDRYQPTTLGLFGFDCHNEAVLLCPSCGEVYLHQNRIEVFDRMEDANTGMHVSVNDGKATIDLEMTGNPSPRRDGLEIGFWCETCTAKSVLIIYQHPTELEGLLQRATEAVVPLFAAGEEPPP